MYRLRGKTYEITVYVGRDPVTGKRLFLRDKAPASIGVRAVKRIEKAMQDRVEGGEAPVGRLTFDDLAERWFTHHGARLAASTLKSYRGYYGRSIKPTIGHVLAEKLTIDQLDRLYDGLAADGMHPKSIHQCDAIVRGVLKYGKRTRLISRNIAPEADPPRVEGNGQVDSPEAASVKAALDLARAEYPMMYVYARIAATCGPRRGEMIALQWDRVDFEKSQLFIDRAWCAVDRKIKPTKNKRKRLVAVDEVTMGLLLDLQAAQLTMYDSYGLPLPDDAFVFEWMPGRHWEANKPTRLWREIADRVGESCPLQDLRHYSVTMGLDSGVAPEKAVAARHGHSVPVMRENYQRVLTPQDRALAEAVAATLD